MTPFDGYVRAQLRLQEWEKPVPPTLPSARGRCPAMVLCRSRPRQPLARRDHHVQPEDSRKLIPRSMIPDRSPTLGLFQASHSSFVGRAHAGPALESRRARTSRSVPTWSRGVDLGSARGCCRSAMTPHKNHENLCGAAPAKRMAPDSVTIL